MGDDGYWKDLISEGRQKPTCRLSQILNTEVYLGEDGRIYHYYTGRVWEGWRVWVPDFHEEHQWQPSIT